MSRAIGVFTIKGRLTGLNEYTKACRANKFMGAKLKRENEAIVLCSIGNIGKFNRVKINYKWYEANRKRDLDNIAFARKFIQDALVYKGILDGDGWAHISGFSDEFYIDKDNPRIEVTLYEQDVTK